MCYALMSVCSLAVAATVYPSKQEAQLSQRDRAMLRGLPQMPNVLRFVAIFSCIPIFRPPPSPPLSSPTSALSNFSPALPFPKKVNKKLSYREQNALSVIKTRTQ